MTHAPAAMWWDENVPDRTTPDAARGEDGRRGRGGRSTRCACPSMHVLVVRIGHMRMRVYERRVAVPMAVLARRNHVVHMVMMAVIVAVCVFMLQRLVLVLVAV